MALPIPKKILRNCTIYVDRVNQIGQASEIQLPAIEFKKETVLNAGMVKEKEINMGVLSALVVTFKQLAIDMDVMRTLAQEDLEYMVVGVLRDSEGGDVIQAVCYMRGKNLKLEFDAWTAGGKAENSYEVAVDYYKYEEDGQPVIEADDFDVSIGGQSVFGYSNTMLNG